MAVPAVVGRGGDDAASPEGGEFQLPAARGHVLFVKERKLHYVCNFLGIPPEQKLVSAKEISHGIATLYIDDEAVASADIRTQTGHFMLCGEGLCIGVDSGDVVTREYEHLNPFTGGSIEQVQFHVGDDAYVDVEKHLEAAFSRD